MVFTAALFLAFEAFAMMPLADATAIGFSKPSIAIMIEPTGQGNRLGAAFAFGGTVLAALGMILQRELPALVSSLSITFYLLLISSLLIAPISYSGMFRVIIIGFVWFDDVPTVRVMMGTGVIFLTTAFAFKIASNTAKRSAVNPPT